MAKLSFTRQKELESSKSNRKLGTSFVCDYPEDLRKPECSLSFIDCKLSLKLSVLAFKSLKEMFLLAKGIFKCIMIAGDSIVNAKPDFL